jgi:hypothetical protein
MHGVVCCYDVLEAAAVFICSELVLLLLVPLRVTQCASCYQLVAIA